MQLDCRAYWPYVRSQSAWRNFGEHIANCTSVSHCMLSTNLMSISTPATPPPVGLKSCDNTRATRWHPVSCGSVGAGQCFPKAGPGYVCAWGGCSACDARAHIEYSITAARAHKNAALRTLRNAHGRSGARHRHNKHGHETSGPRGGTCGSAGAARGAEAIALPTPATKLTRTATPIS